MGSIIGSETVRIEPSPTSSRSITTVERGSHHAPDPTAFDLAFQPRSYWGPASLQDHFGARVTGEVRRQGIMADAAADQAITEPLSIDDPERSRRAAIHPMLMGGEYMPPLETDEVEIARIVFQSTMLDVISIRARRHASSITYRIVDEELFWEYACSPESTPQPLTLGQLIELMEKALPGGMINAFREQVYHSDPREVFSFARVSSVFYPPLEAWFDQCNEEWLAREIEGLGDDEE